MRWIYWILLATLGILKELIFNQLTIKQVQNNYWVKYKIDFLFDLVQFIPEHYIPIAKATLLIGFVLLGIVLSYQLAKLYAVQSLYVMILKVFGFTVVALGILYSLTSVVNFKLFAINLLGMLFTPLPIFISVLIGKLSNPPANG